MRKGAPLPHGISKPIIKGINDRISTIKESIENISQLENDSAQSKAIEEAFNNVRDRTGSLVIFKNTSFSRTFIEGCHLLIGPQVIMNTTRLGVSEGIQDANRLTDLYTALTELADAKAPSGGLCGVAFKKSFAAQSEEAYERAQTAKNEGGSKSLPEADRLALLDSAAHYGAAGADPIQALEERTRNKAIELLGGEAVLGRHVRNDEDLVEALTTGLPSKALRSLQEAGYSHKVLEQVVAPRRTLMRRRATGQRLTRGESDAVWRLARVFVLASEVLNGSKAAIAWLTRAKAAFANRTPVDFLETSVGTVHVERLLRRLDWGDVA